MSWQPSQNCKLAAAIWNFHEEGNHHLSICVGDLIVVIEELAGWYRGYLYHYPSKMGIFPISYVQPIDYKVIPAGEEDAVVPNIDQVALEARESLYEWKHKLFSCFATGLRQNYFQIFNYMEYVMTTRSALIHSNVTHDKLHEMRTSLSARIDLVNSLCELPLAPRDDNGYIIDPHVTSIGQLYNIHHKRQSEVKKRVSHTGWEQKKTQTSLTSMAHHLYLVVRHISHQFPEDSEVFLFLYDSDTKRQVSERFLIDVPRASDSPQRHSNDNNKPPKQHYCMFKDLGAREMQSHGLFLVCKVIRKGKMLLDDKKNVTSCLYRRPYAVGVLDLKPALDESNNEQGDDDDDYQMTYTMPLQICVTHEHDFGTLHLSLMKKSKQPSSSKGGVLLSMALRFIRGDFQQLQKDFPYLINKNTVEVNKLGFPDVILPGHDRNDVYVTLEYGQFEKGSKMAERNVEVAIAVCNSEGRIVPGCIMPAAGSIPLSEYESFIYYHNNTPKWLETFKLSIPPADISGCHLRIGFRHVAKNEGKDKMEKTFAFSHLKLMKDNGAILPDGTHELFVYKADSKKSHDPKYYLAVESAKELGLQQSALSSKTTTRGRTFASRASTESTLSSSGQSVARSQREIIYISTLTCSTKVTQKVEMLSLLKWRHQSPRDLPMILCNVVHIDGEEIIKFLQDVLDSLFTILASNHEHYGDTVFTALISIFSLLSDEKYSHFIPILDVYITKHFSAAHAYKTLLWCLHERLKEREIPKQSSLTTLVKSIRFLFHFIVQSYSLSSNPQSSPGFHQGLDNCFSSMCELLRSPENRYHGIHAIQLALLANLPSILPHLIKVYSQRQLAGILARVIDSVQNDHPSLPGEKMAFIIAVLDSDINLLHPQESRITIFPTVVGHLVSHIENKMPDNGYRSDDSGNKGCLRCVGKVLDIIHMGDELHINFDDTQNVTPLLRPLLSLCKTFQDSNNPLRGESFVNLMSLLKVMTDNHYTVFFDSMKIVEKDRRNSGGRENMLKDFIIELLEVLEKLVKVPSISSDWVYMLIVLNVTLMRVLKNTFTTIFSSFFDDHSFNPQIWDILFGTCKLFITQSCLQLEQYSDLLRAKLIRQFGDMRVTMGKQVDEMWHLLVDKKTHFIPDFIGPFLEISLMKEKELRQVSIPLIFDIMKFELKSFRNFKRVEKEVFEKMDNLVSKGYGDEAYRDLFHECMTSLCHGSKELKATGDVFVDTVSRLIGLILDYRRVEGNTSQHGQRMGCILNLLNFYKEIEREELYIRYIYKLADLHQSDGNFTEAGLTLLLHANTLEWTVDFEPAVEGKYPVHTSRERKEILYMDAIKLLDQGKTWESGIPLCKELAQVYETKQYNYKKLSDILRTQADFFHKIITELRVENEYFVVAYYGKGFPLFLRNKTFIHRGQPYERLQNFMKKLTDEFISAQIYMAAESPGDDIKNSSGMYLQIRKVLPIPDEREEFKEANVKVPDKITEYYKTNEVCRFRYDRPFHKGKKNKECEFATLWIERTSYTTASSFPGVINSFEVCDIEPTELGPLDIARETVSSKVDEIQKMTSEMTSNSQMNINPLSMLLKGVIDAAVMGGISNYDKIFFQPQYIQDYPEHKEDVEKLRDLIKEQVEVLKKALALHGERVSSDLKAFHQELERSFEVFQDTVFPERRKSSITAPRPKITTPGSTATINRPLPPTPIQDMPLSQPKTPHRRNTGGNPNRLSAITDSPPSSNKVKRSLTQKPVRTAPSSDSPPERRSVFDPLPNTSDSSSSISSKRDSEIIELDDDPSIYEMVDIEHNPAPKYPPPPRPPPSERGAHSYAVIDIADGIADDDDSDGYTEVTLDARQKRNSVKKSKSEFESTAILRGLPPSRSRSRSRSRSPPTKRNSLMDRRSPPHSPTERHLMPMEFTRKSPSPGTLSDSEPVMEDLETIRARLRKSAEDSVKVAEKQAKPTPTVPYKRTDSTPVIVNNYSGTTKPRSETAPNNVSNHSVSCMALGSQSGPGHQSGPGQMPRKQSFPTHLPSNQPGQLPGNQPSKATLPSVPDYDHLSSVMETDNDTYSLAEPWQQDPPPQTGTGTHNQSSEVSSTYDVLTSPPSNGEDSPSKRVHPRQPPPYSMTKITSQTNDPTIGAPANTPPPVPRKKTMKSKPTSETTEVTSSNKDPLEDIRGLPPKPKGPPPPPQPRPRSQTSSANRTSQNYSTTAPVPIPRKPFSSVSSTIDSETPPPLSSDLFSTPPRPPKPSVSSVSSPPEEECPPPALPPRIKPEIPVLPPRPAKPKDYPQVVPRNRPPPPPK